MTPEISFLYIIIFILFFDYTYSSNLDLRDKLLHFCRAFKNIYQVDILTDAMKDI